MESYNIDYDRLRWSLKDYYGTAMAGGFPMAMMDVSRVEKADEEELLEMAEDIGLDIRKYVKY